MIYELYSDWNQASEQYSYGDEAGRQIYIDSRYPIETNKTD